MNRLISTLAILTLGVATSCNNSGSVKNNNTLTNDSSKEVIIIEGEKPSFLSRYPLLTWAKKNPVEIGCMFEKEFSYRDTIFNCNYKNYVNKGDPCKNTKEYYEGINFPVELASKVNSSIKDINLEFEHGKLRQISITFKDSLLKNEIHQIFNLPTARKDFPDNVMEIQFDENIFSEEKSINTNYTKRLTITGFEHIGSGEVDCN